MNRVAGRTRHVPRSLVLATAAAAVASATTAWVLAAGGDVGVDLALHHWLADHPSHAVHVMATWAKQPGTRIVYLITVGVAAAAGLQGRRSVRPVLLAAVLVAVETAVLFGMKVAVGRRSPRSGLVAIHTAGTSFPGGHAANAVLGAGLVGWWAVHALVAPSPERARRAAHAAAVLAAVVGGIVGAAMTWLDFHWLTDTVAGWAVGAAFLAAGIGIDHRLSTARAEGRADGQCQTVAPRRSRPPRSKMSESK